MPASTNKECTRNVGCTCTYKECRPTDNESCCIFNITKFSLSTVAVNIMGLQKFRRQTGGYMLQCCTAITTASENSVTWLTAAAGRIVVAHPIASNNKHSWHYYHHTAQPRTHTHVVPEQFTRVRCGVHTLKGKDKTRGCVDVVGGATRLEAERAVSTGCQSFRVRAGVRRRLLMFAGGRNSFRW